MSRERTQGRGPLIFLAAGEPSGDLLGARLMAGLKALAGGQVRFAGVGGEAMAREGLVSLFPMADLTVMGFVEVVPRLPVLLRRIRETVRTILAVRPAAVVTIDSPGFSFRVAKRVAGRGIPLIHFVAPSVWAYAPGRARRVARFLDHILALLPFEPPYFEAEGLACTCVGHPVVEYGAEAGDGAGFRRRHEIPADCPLIAVLPGSRPSETTRLLPIFAETLGLLADRFPDLRAVAPTVPTVADAVAAAASAWPVPALVTTAAEKYDAFAASDVALAASGTVSVELAVAGVPHVVAYRLGPLTSMVARRLRRTEFVSIVNLVMGREVVRELLLENCRSDMLAAEAGRLLADPAAAESQRRALAAAVDGLRTDGEAPSLRAARVVLDIIAEASATEEHDGGNGGSG